MGQGKKMSLDIQWAIVRMSGRLSYDEISMYLDVSTRSVRRMMLYFRDYGIIPDAQDSSAQEERQKNRHLRGIDVEFLLNTIKKTPDVYLDELQTMIALECGKDVSRSTIWRTLRRCGLTMKKVRIYLINTTSV
ncbi:hypothetical protein SCLCIDRAFT_1166606 [Scleroderma citrinum Foug A]|uniref:Transposase Tc1-like domain-containing protein n=2 Tax=Scleroderma citrinum Foug A TaxID=1036808 RepID=A0A0C3D5G8_9AGAM|nr:hypothetical protein SCLCIDRAFT_1166606 [Scleroderma citrinum Foug A]